MDRDVRGGAYEAPLILTRIPGRVNSSALQLAYAQMLADGLFSNQAELARRLGVSRIWVSRVLKGIK